MAKDCELFGVLNVWCSANKCRFKRNSGYYNKCHNPSVLNSYKMFVGGNVHVSGCNMKCEGCTKEDCDLSEYAVLEKEEFSKAAPNVGEPAVIEIVKDIE